MCRYPFPHYSNRKNFILGYLIFSIWPQFSNISYAAFKKLQRLLVSDNLFNFLTLDTIRNKKGKVNKHFFYFRDHLLLSLAHPCLIVHSSEQNSLFWALLYVNTTLSLIGVCTNTLNIPQVGTSSCFALGHDSPISFLQLLRNCRNFSFPYRMRFTFWQFKAIKHSKGIIFIVIEFVI